MLAVTVLAPVTALLRNDCRRQMETMLALCVAYEVLCTPDNFRAAIVRTIKRRLMPPEMFGTKMPCQAINTPRLLPLALSYLVVGPLAERTEWQPTFRALHGELFHQRLFLESGAYASSS